MVRVRLTLRLAHFSLCSQSNAFNGSTMMKSKNIRSTVCSDFHLRRKRKQGSLSAWKNSSSRLMLLSTTSASTVQLRLPASLDSLLTLSLTVYIHDTLHTKREFSLPSIQIRTDVSVIDDLNNSSSFVNQLLHYDDLTIAGQMIYSLVQILDEIGEENLLQATRSKWSDCEYPRGRDFSLDGLAATRLSVTPLNRQYPTTVNVFLRKEFGSTVGTHSL